MPSPSWRPAFCVLDISLQRDIQSTERLHFRCRHRGAGYIEAKEFLTGYYIVDCETVERAQELAALIPDARFSAVEVRPVMNEAGLEM